MERRFDLITLFGDGEGSVWSQRYRKGGSQKCGKPLKPCRECGLYSQINMSSEPGSALVSSVTLDKSLFLFTLQPFHLWDRSHQFQLQGRKHKAEQLGVLALELYALSFDLGLPFTCSVAFPVWMLLTSRDIQGHLNWFKPYKDVLSHMRTLELLQDAGVVQLMDRLHQNSRSTFYTLLCLNADPPLSWQVSWFTSREEERSLSP